MAGASATFDPSLAASLAGICELTYVQYQQGGNGQITPPAGFQQTASFSAPELDITSGSHLIAAALAPAFDVTSPMARALLRDMAHTLGFSDVYFGFSLEPSAGSPAGYNVVALRGTRSIQEWIEDATVIQIPVPLNWFNPNFKGARINLGFLLIFAFLVEQILAAVNALQNPALPLYVTGHSLGGALAALAAPAIDFLGTGYAGTGILNRVQMYSFAGPRPGDPGFAKGYNSILPATFRVVNLADVVPILPPTALAGYTYAQVGGPGSEWSYLWQTGDVANNHALTTNYIPAVTPAPGVETNAPRKYPTSGL
jgi:hypothetical protein